MGDSDGGWREGRGEGREILYSWLPVYIDVEYMYKLRREGGREGGREGERSRETVDPH